MNQKIKQSFYYFNLIILLIITSCAKEKENTQKEDSLKIIKLNYDFHNYIENVRGKSNPPRIRKRNFIEINVNEKGECKIKGEIVQDSLIVLELKKYIIPNSTDSEMPTTIEKEFNYSGKVLITKQLLILGFYDKNLSYKDYSKIRNKIYVAYSEVRDEFAKKNFNKGINELLNSSEEIDYLKGKEITTIFPVLYTEVID